MIMLGRRLRASERKCRLLSFILFVIFTLVELDWLVSNENIFAMNLGPKVPTFTRAISFFTREGRNWNVEFEERDGLLRVLVPRRKIRSISYGSPENAVKLLDTMKGERYICLWFDHSEEPDGIIYIRITGYWGKEKVFQYRTNPQTSDERHIIHWIDTEAYRRISGG